MTSAREMTDEELIGAWRVFTDGVARTQAQIAHDLEALDLPVASFDALHRLLEAREHRLPMSMLARELQMTSGGFTKVADRMARAGLIDRRGTAGDRRVVHATLTEKGEQLAAEAVTKYKSSLRRNLLGVLPTPAFTRLVELGATLRTAHASTVPVEVSEQVAAPHDESQPERRSGERREGSAADRREGSAADRREGSAADRRDPAGAPRRPGDPGFVERRGPRPGQPGAAGYPPRTGAPGQRPGAPSGRPGMIPPGQPPGAYGRQAPNPFPRPLPGSPPPAR